MIVAVAAMDLNGLIGLDDGLPWDNADLAADRWRLRRITYGNPVIMGSRTYNSIGTFTEKRKIIRLTGNTCAFRRHESHVLARTVPDALQSALDARRETYSDRTIIAGGASVYDQTIDLWDRLELTIVQHRFDLNHSERQYWIPLPVLNAVNRHAEGSIKKSAFWVSAQSFHPVDEQNKYPMTFLTMVAERHRSEVRDYVAARTNC